MKLACTLEYDGAAYFGFQLQAGLRTIQGELERSLRQATGEEIRVTAAGRTDTGVHALGQVVSFRSETSLPPATLVRAVNYYLPQDIAVQSAWRVRESFDARRSARSRQYRYYILDRPVRSPLWRRYAYRVSYQFDLPAMQEACSLLVGEHDFAAFAAAADQVGRHTVRTIYAAELKREDDLLVLDVVANAFLTHQVRNTVGTLLEVGRGKLAVARFAALLTREERRPVGPAAPPHGLYLVRVNYPEEELEL